MSKTTKKETKVEALSKVEGRKAKTETPETTVSETKVEASSEVTTPATPETAKQRTAKVRGKKYRDAKNKVDVAKYYPLADAVKLVKETSFSKFEGKVEAHVTATEEGNMGEITFPHLEASSKKIVIADDSVIAAIKDGKIDFDILVASPAVMPKLLPLAKTLGPKGLMPNPKNGTLSPNPEEAVKRLSVAKTVVKTEKKGVVVHIVVGKVSQPAEELSANIAELIKVVKPTRIRKFVICATMGPAIKIEVK